MKEQTFTIHNVNNNIDWTKYLIDLDMFLKGKDFKKYNQNHKRETFAYWKIYDEKYQIGLLVYDLRDYPLPSAERKVSIAFECMPLNIDGRCDLCVSKDIELNDFEMMADSFYNVMAEYCY